MRNTNELKKRINKVSDILNEKISFLNSFSQTYKWGVIEMTRLEDDLYLKYQYDEWSNTLFNNHETYLRFHKIFKVTTGWWDGEKGFWLSAKRIEKEIRCINASQLKEENSKSGFAVSINKKPFSNSINIEVKSESIGNVKFNCSAIEQTHHIGIGLFENEINRFSIQTNRFDENFNFCF